MLQIKQIKKLGEVFFIRKIKPARVILLLDPDKTKGK